jgi:hypothetical protein
MFLMISRVDWFLVSMRQYLFKKLEIKQNRKRINGTT